MAGDWSRLGVWLGCDRLRIGSMMQYRFLKNYRSAFGQWKAGDVADFDDETAAWLNRDEPGCLEAETPSEAEPAATTDSKRAIDKAPHDRQLKAPKKTRSGPVVDKEGGD